jgi:primary-amine oxidase
MTVREPLAPTAGLARHPLDPLSAEEISANKRVLELAGKVSAATRFPLVSLDEPDKASVLAFQPGEPIDRRVASLLLDMETGAAFEAVVSVSRGELLSWREVTGRQAPFGQPPVMDEEYGMVAEIVKADQGWREALAKRGITDLDLVFVAPLSAGEFGLPGEGGRRLLRALCFRQDHPKDSPWAHPVDGLVAYVDLIARQVVEVLDDELIPVPAEQGNFDRDSVGPARTSLRRLEITQPDGPSFTVDGSVISWENWRMRASFDPREGLILHQIGYQDGERERPVLYRASIAEMVVPYGDPSPVRFWQSYFDVGEYSFGKLANSLVLGCDCLGEIRYLDTVRADERGEPLHVPNVVCLHEEDYGVLWKHTDVATGLAETRRSRRLVVSFFVTVGNYDYGFYWYFYLDGTIELECKATGVVFTAGVRPGGERWATKLTPELAAPLHQHLFCARLDVTVDGMANSVREVDFERVPIGADNPHGNAFTLRATTLERESEAGRVADASVGRTWDVVNPEVLGRTGEPVGYKLVPTQAPLLLADPASSLARRAAFATRHLWVTRYDPAERYPAGDYPNQHQGGAGLPAYVAADRPIAGQDIVLWHTFGMSHAPRPEDWPVMPVDRVGFALKPVGFFDRNPALDVPEGSGSGAAGHCH